MDSKLDAAEESLLCALERDWEKIVTKIRFGAIAPWQGLRNFLMLLAHRLETFGEQTELDKILASVMRSTLPSDRKDLTALEEASLSVLEQKWNELAQEVRAGTLALLPGMQDFMRLVGQYLLGFVQPSKEKSRVDSRRTMIEEFFAGRGFPIRVPMPRVTEEQYYIWLAEERDLFFRPPEREAPTRKLIKAFSPEGHWLLGGEAEKMVGWEPAEDGYWFLIEAQEECPRAGKLSYGEFERALQPDQRIAGLEEYLVFWHVGGIGGIIPDTETHTMLRARYGGSSVLHAFGHVSHDRYEFLVRTWGTLTIRQAKMGVRVVEMVPSA